MFVNKDAVFAEHYRLSLNNLRLLVSQTDEKDMRYSRSSRSCRINR